MAELPLVADDGAVLGRAVPHDGTDPPRTVVTVAPGAPADQVAAAALRTLSGHRISLRDQAAAEALVALGVPLLRASWLLVLDLPPAVVPGDTPGPGLRWQPLDPDPARHVPVMVAAYAAGHPDHDEFVATPEAAATELASYRTGGAMGPVLEDASGEVVDADGALLGYCVITAVPADEEFAGGPWVTDLAVDPAAQGRGVGRLLLTRAVERLAAGGHPRLGLAVTRGNDRARRLYDALGFTEHLAAWTFVLPPR